MKSTLIVISAATLLIITFTCTCLAAQRGTGQRRIPIGVVVKSGWHYITPYTLAPIPLDGEEISDPDDLHDPDGLDIRIPDDGLYEVSVEGMFGLWPGGPPSTYGVYADRELRVMCIPDVGTARWVALVYATANVTSQAYIRLGGTRLELNAGDRLRFFLRYNTNEWELPVILSRVSVRRIAG